MDGLAEMSKLGAETLNQFIAIVGEQNVASSDSDKAPYLTEWRDRYQGNSPLILKPSSTDEVSEILRLAYKTETPVVPQGGNTGLVGGQIPFETGEELVLNLSRLDKIRQLDAQSNLIIVEAGATLQSVQEAAERENRFFPLSLGSEGTCQIGGNLSTNAGGTAVLAYGNMRDLTLGLEVVMADGQIWHGLRTLRKDNTGYDLKHLFIGAEGTLGVITAASLKLFPKPTYKSTMFLGIESPDSALELFHLAQEKSGGTLTSFELMPRIGLEFVIKHTSNSPDPLVQPYPWYIVMETSHFDTQDTDSPELDEFFSLGTNKGLILDGILASNLAQANKLWRYRLLLSEVQKHEGGSIKHDISVPVGVVPDFLKTADMAVLKHIPNARIVAFGHLGDGNIHYNISQPVGTDKSGFLQQWETVNQIVHDIVVEFGGSISAEHGIGRMKRDLLPQVKSPVELELMKTIKKTLDPKGILNPGKLLQM